MKELEKLEVEQINGGCNCVCNMPYGQTHIGQQADALACAEVCILFGKSASAGSFFSSTMARCD